MQNFILKGIRNWSGGFRKFHTQIFLITYVTQYNIENLKGDGMRMFRTFNSVGYHAQKHTTSLRQVALSLSEELAVLDSSCRI